MTQPEIAQLAESLDRNERTALAILPVPDRGNMDDEVWWLFYALLDRGLLTGGNDNMMRRTELGEAVFRHLRASEAG